MSTTGDQLGEQAKEVPEGLQEMGEAGGTLPRRSSGNCASMPRSRGETKSRRCVRL